MAVWGRLEPVSRGQLTIAEWCRSCENVFAVRDGSAKDADAMEELCGDTVLQALAPSCADAEVTELSSFICRIPTLHDAVEALRQVLCIVMLEPFRFHQAAAQGRGGLLILAGEVVFADRACRRMKQGSTSPTLCAPLVTVTAPLKIGSW